MNYSDIEIASSELSDAARDIDFIADVFSAAPQLVLKHHYAVRLIMTPAIENAARIMDNLHQSSKIQ